MQCCLCNWRNSSCFLRSMHLTAKNDYTARRWPCQEIVAFPATATTFDPPPCAAAKTILRSLICEHFRNTHLFWIMCIINLCSRNPCFRIFSIKISKLAKLTVNFKKLFYKFRFYNIWNSQNPKLYSLHRLMICSLIIFSIQPSKKYNNFSFSKSQSPKLTKILSNHNFPFFSLLHST